jgi:uncharacterized protein with von Willebrand factor type A (vWA) domain
MMIFQRTSLSENIVQFCRHLRQKGFTIGVEEEAITLQALQFIDYTGSNLFRLVLKSTLCKSKIQAEEFDIFFNDYWKVAAKAVDTKSKDNSSKKLTAVSQPSSLKSVKAWLHGKGNDAKIETATYSIHESLSRKDFSAISNEDMDELMQVLRTLAKHLSAKKHRRYKHSHKIKMPDVRQTLRKNLGHGGELLDIAYRKPKRQLAKLVLLCDVSKSMQLYTTFLIQFMYAFQQVYTRIETFTFGTSLKRITPLLNGNSFQEALNLLALDNHDWDGGTRIGESLNTFVKTYPKLLDSKSIVIILSDGWDNGNMVLLKTSMEFLHRRAKKIIWLNPLAGYVSYRPDTAGMQTAMPFIDVFAPAHNIESLRRLGNWLL